MSLSRRRPTPIGIVLPDVLQKSGVQKRVEQANVIPEWPSLVGAQIAAVTAPQSVTADGTLFVLVATNAWMMELSLMEPELLRTLNRVEGRAPIRRLRWILRR